MAVWASPLGYCWAFHFQRERLIRTLVAHWLWASSIPSFCSQHKSAGESKKKKKKWQSNPLPVWLRRHSEWRSCQESFSSWRSWTCCIAVAAAGRDSEFGSSDPWSKRAWAFDTKLKQPLSHGSLIAVFLCLWMCCFLFQWCPYV